MNITDILGRAGGLRSMARELGIDESQAARGAEALLPAILGGLAGMLDRDGNGNPLDDILRQVGRFTR